MHRHRIRSDNTTRTESSIEPVSVEELRVQARIDYTDHDEELGSLITEARKTIEEADLGRLLLNSTCVDKFDRFAEMELRWSPVSSITSITYLDGDGTSQTLSTDIYELGFEYGIGVVRLKFNQVWPTTRLHEDAVTVTYVAGFGATRGDVPPGLKRAVKLMADYRYGGSTETELKEAAARELDPYRRKRFV